jgi:hypothetical protein
MMSAGPTGLEPAVYPRHPLKELAVKALTVATLSRVARGRQATAVAALGSTSGPSAKDGRWD